MPQPERAGRYVGRIMSQSVVQKDSGVIQFEAQLELTELEGRVLPQALTTRAWLTLIKKDGKRNEATIRNLKEALGWDGLSLQSLTGTEECPIDWSGTPVGVVIDEETYNGEKKLKVNWIQRPGGSVKAPTAQALSAMEARFAGQQFGSDSIPMAEPIKEEDIPF